MITTRTAEASDISNLHTFILTHGPNAWNYLPVEGVRDHLTAIASGEVQAIMAEEAGRLVGFVTLMVSSHLARYLRDSPNQQHGYIGEAVVDQSLAGRGIGSRLLQLAVTTLQQQGLKTIFVERHEENLGSAGMMRKAGFVECDTFDDPARRPNGSRRTTVCVYAPQSLGQG
ncbi:GNAT family N-acetyltransferase [Chitinivorax sp. B]|uniref:GNAT family N-acetyltransferase n=1 Tax=Chitinivorax sp. B TaxID=2502235 RepID=UPI0010F81A92|nr:GNAT family N-acetyltransferase [Chitinivorax sp. B]